MLPGHFKPGTSPVWADSQASSHALKYLLIDLSIGFWALYRTKPCSAATILMVHLDFEGKRFMKRDMLRSQQFCLALRGALEVKMDLERLATE
jgi:hypothetical protein